MPIESPAAGPADARCVLCVPEGATADEHLMTLLARRRWQVTPHTDLYLAMAETCLMACSGPAREGGEALAFVLAAPPPGQTAPRHARLVAAIARYVPAASVWLYADGALRPLAGQRARDADPLATGDGASLPPRDPPRPAAPWLQLTEAPPADPGGLPSAPRAEPPAPSDADDALDADDESVVVTAEEIAMLFGDPAPPEPPMEPAP